MEVYFNELSLENNQAVQYQDMTRLKDLYSSLEAPKKPKQTACLKLLKMEICIMWFITN